MYGIWKPPRACSVHGSRILLPVESTDYNHSFDPSRRTSLKIISSRSIASTRTSSGDSIRVPLQKRILRTLLQNDPNPVSLDLELPGVSSEISDVPTTSDTLCILLQAQKVSLDTVKVTLLEIGPSEPDQSDGMAFEVRAASDGLGGIMQLEQTVGDPTTASFAKRQITVSFTPANITLANLEKLSGRSLLIPFKLNAALTSKVEVSSDQEQRADLPVAEQVKTLDHGLQIRKGSERTFRLRHPVDHANEWRIVALVLLTYGTIGVPKAHRSIMGNTDQSIVKGFDWPQALKPPDGLGKKSKAIDCLQIPGRPTSQTEIDHDEVPPAPVIFPLGMYK